MLVFIWEPAELGLLPCFFISHSFPHFTLGFIPRSWISFPAGKSEGQPRKDEQKVVPVLGLPLFSHQSWVLGKVLGDERHWFPPKIWSAGSASLSFQDCSLFLGTLLFHTYSSFQNSSPWFPNLNSPCAEAECVTSPMIGGSCLLSIGRLGSCHFSFIHMCIHPHTWNNLLPVSITNLKFFHLKTPPNDNDPTMLLFYVAAQFRVYFLVKAKANHRCLLTITWEVKENKKSYFSVLFSSLLCYFHIRACQTDLSMSSFNCTW